MRHGYLLGASGNTVESLRRLRQSIAVLEPLASGGEAAASEELATAYSRLGEVLEGGNAVPGVVPDLPEALHMHRQALALDRALLASEPTSVARRRSVVADHFNIGQVTDRSSDREGALDEYRLALPIIESLSAEDPANAQARSDEASVRQRIGTILARQGDAQGALPHLERALRLLEELSAKDPSNLFTRSQIAETHIAFGFARAAQGAEQSRRSDERRELYREAKDHFEKGLAFWTEARERGVTTGAESEKPEELAREIAACDRALAALSPPIGR
jgi:tetratricopeptide (TPR) repeat protein